jgi:hypothetical protein
MHLQWTQLRFMQLQFMQPIHTASGVCRIESQGVQSSMLSMYGYFFSTCNTHEIKIITAKLSKSTFLGGAMAPPLDTPLIHHEELLHVSILHTHTRLVIWPNPMHCSMLLASTTRHQQQTQINTRPFHCLFHCWCHTDIRFSHHHYIINAGCFMLWLPALHGEFHYRFWFSCSSHPISVLRCLVARHRHSRYFRLGR